MLLAIVIPCYNEESRLPKEEFLEYVGCRENINFLFVNDGSVDGTKEMLVSLCARHARLHFLNLPQNEGKAEAVRQGVLFAQQHFDTRYIGFWDADLATPLNEIDRMISVLGEKQYDIMTGLRLLRLGANVSRKRTRHFFGRVFATVTARVLNINVYDTQCGAKLFKTNLITQLFNQPFVSKWFFDIEILARYINLHGKDAANNCICEFPILQWNDVGGSKLKMKDFITVPFELLKIKRHYFKKRKNGY
jgi:glycosyltransferase involved in cell wall biosynthesis